MVTSDQYEEIMNLDHCKTFIERSLSRMAGQTSLLADEIPQPEKVLKDAVNGYGKSAVDIVLASTILSIPANLLNPMDTNHALRLWADLTISESSDPKCYKVRCAVKFPETAASMPKNMVQQMYAAMLIGLATRHTSTTSSRKESDT